MAITSTGKASMEFKVDEVTGTESDEQIQQLHDTAYKIFKLFQTTLEREYISAKQRGL